VVHIAQVFFGNFSHVSTASDLHGDQALSRQNLQGLSQGRAANAIGFGNLKLINPAARLEFPAEDALPNEFGNFFIQRSGRQRRYGNQGSHGG